MEIEIPCEIVGRLTHVSETLAQSEKREWLRSVFVERADNHAFIGATNSQFAAIHYLGPNKGDDGFTIVRNSELMLDAARNPDSLAIWKISDWPMMNFGSVKTPFGESSVDPIIRDLEAISTLRKWRNWFPNPQPSETGRPMFLDVDGLQNLVESSPSGAIIMPKIIDAAKPIIIRDRYEPNWLGVFFAQPEGGIFINGAEMPDWVK